MATHSSILAWEIPWMEPGSLKSMELPRVGQLKRLSMHIVKMWPTIYRKFTKRLKKHGLESCLLWRDSKVDQKRLDFVWIVSSSHILLEKSSAFDFTLLCPEHLGTSLLSRAGCILLILVFGSSDMFRKCWGMTQQTLENREAESLPKGLDLGVSRKLVYPEWREIWVSEGKALVVLLEVSPGFKNE